MRRLRWALAVSLLSLQLGGILYARLVSVRYFCWAPYDVLTVYFLQVKVNGRPLSADEVWQRYRRPERGMDNRSPQNLIEIVELTEQRYHPQDRVEVVMTLNINGRQHSVRHFQQP